jgi:copper chaperone CopZ
LDLQTFVLKVSIHCHGCKKKVRKVLKSVEGTVTLQFSISLLVLSSSRANARRISVWLWA